MAKATRDDANIAGYIDTTSCQFWIDDYRNVTAKKITSQPWVSAGASWRLTVYPHGREEKEHRKFLAAYVAADEDPARQQKRDALVKFVLPSGFVDIPHAKYKFRRNKVKKHGYTKMCQLSEIQEHHLYNDSLVVRMELQPLAQSTGHHQEKAKKRVAADVQLGDSASNDSCVILQLKGDVSMSEYFNTNTFYDIIMITGCGERFKCHRVVLAAASKPLAAMLTNGMLESRATEILLPIYSASTVQAFLQFIYGIPVEVQEACQLYELACMADQYGVEVLLHQCAAALEGRLRDGRQLNIDLACSILTTTSIPALHQVHQMALMYIMVRLEAALEEPCFTQLPAEAIQQLLEADPLRPASEKLTLLAVLRWVDADLSQRWRLFSELIQLVRVYGMCLEELKESLELVVDFLEKWRGLDSDAARSLLLKLTDTRRQVSSMLAIKADKALELGSGRQPAEPVVPAELAAAPALGNSRMRRLFQWLVCYRECRGCLVW